MEQKRVLISISNQNVHWNDHLLVLQKVSLEANDLSSCFMPIALGKIGNVCFILLLRVQKQSLLMQMLAVIPIEFPTFAIEHGHDFTH